MSPLIHEAAHVLMRFPRPRGDEPGSDRARDRPVSVFPTRAGMSRTGQPVVRTMRRFPRPRGDEPTEIKEIRGE